MLVPIIPPPTITVSALSLHSFETVFWDELNNISFLQYYVVVRSNPGNRNFLFNEYCLLFVLIVLIPSEI